MTTEGEKWKYLQAAPARDAGHPVIRHMAALLRELVQMSRPSSETIARIRYADLALTIARDWIRYETDTDRTGGEDIAGFTRPATRDDAVDALWRGVDDCDAKARLFVALCLAGGIEADTVPHWTNDRLAHVSGAFSADGATWLPVETTLTRARIGDTQETIPKETETGKWETS